MYYYSLQTQFATSSLGIICGTFPRPPMIPSSEDCMRSNLMTARAPSMKGLAKPNQQTNRRENGFPTGDSNHDSFRLESDTTTTAPLSSYFGIIFLFFSLFCCCKTISNSEALNDFLHHESTEHVTFPN